MFETRDGFTTAQESECEWGRKRLLKKVIEDHVEKNERHLHEWTQKA